MATTTTNFGWTIPQSTDLVKDGATAISTLGSGIDTSMMDLKGGTTGQMLTKNSNTDMDFVWATPNPGDITGVTAGTGLSGGGTSGDVTLSIDSTVTTLTGTQTLTNKTLTSPVLTTPSISTIDAKGDLLAGTADNTIARLAVGTNGQVLTADSTTATGLKWAASSGGGFTLLSTTSLSAVTTTLSSIDQNYKHLVLILKNCYTSGGDSIYVRPNAATSGYYYGGIRIANGAANYYNNWNSSRVPVSYGPTNGAAAENGQATVWFYNYTTTTNKSYQVNGYSRSTTSSTDTIFINGVYVNSAAMTSLEINGNADTVTGTAYLYGVS